MLYVALRAAPGRLFKARLKKTVEQQQTGELNRLDGRERTRDQSAEVCLLLWEERAPHCVPNDRCAALHVRKPPSQPQSGWDGPRVVALPRRSALSVVSSRSTDRPTPSQQ
jgi:hypothetical protein